MKNQVEEVKTRLVALCEPGFQKFSATLIPGEERMLGVRLPALRALAKELAHGDGWQNYLSAAPRDYFEEIMLRGMIIGAAKMPIEERLCHIRNFVPEIDNWSVCDSFCAGLKFTSKNLPLMLEFLCPYCESEKEFEARFGYVLLLDFFLVPEYIDAALALVSSFSHPAYYARMAVAWLLATALAKFPDKAFSCLTSAPLDDFTYKKTIQKALESYRVSPENKEKLRALRSELRK
ncbi:MAG: DNA alkylation repair protein [Oscillospiraceae bacterium]|nr:DNA alkylation repair protein [Oscillospiraceae bacterium]